MAPNQPLLATEPAGQGAATFKDKMKANAKKGGMFCVGGLCTVFVVLCIIQGLLYAWITAGCGPKAIGDDYSFPGGGKSVNGTSVDNLIPQLGLLSERGAGGFWGWPFDLLPANEAGSTAGAQTGTFWRNNGVLFYTYTYEDIANSKLTAYMRKRFWMPYMDFMLHRCDGKGPVYTFTEGGNWISNKIRKFFKMNQAQTYLLYADGDLVGNIQEIASDYPSLTLNDESDGKEKASAILKSRNFHGSQDQWYISNHYSDDVPYWVTAMIALPTAYDMASEKAASEKTKAEDKDKEKKPATFLFESAKTGAKHIISTDQLHQSTKIGTATSGTATSGTGTGTSTGGTATSGTATSGTGTGTSTGGTATAIATAPLRQSASEEKKGDNKLQHV